MTLYRRHVRNFGQVSDRNDIGHLLSKNIR